MIIEATISQYSEIRDIADVTLADIGDDYGSVVISFATNTMFKTFVYEAADGKVAGFIQVGFYPVDKQKTFLAEIPFFAIAPSYQGQGIGTLLLKHIFNYVDPMIKKGEVVSIELAVAVTNQCVYRFYRKHGFTEKDEDYGYYLNGQKAIRMELKEGVFKCKHS